MDMKHGITPDYCKDAVKAYRMDCMDFMRKVPDGWYDLAVVDPMYIMPAQYYCPGSDTASNGVKRKNIKQARQLSKVKPVDMNYYNELIRVSKEQIIWGINTLSFPVGSGRVIWDKQNVSSSFSDAEIASCSSIVGVRIFRYTWNGFIQENMKEKEKRIHAFQKPVALYKWLFSKYAKLGQRLLDTHGGSMSSGIAALEMGCEIDICELDETYFADAVNRLEQHSQLWLAI